MLKVDSWKKLSMGNDNGVKTNGQSPAPKSNTSLLNFGTAVLLWLTITCGPCFALLPYENPITGNLLVTSLIFFNNLNIFIAICEICLGLEIMFIKAHYQDLCKSFRGNEWAACRKFILEPLTVSQLFDTKTWAKMWSTYSLFDNSYQNHESFGFFIDVGNGYSTIAPCVLLNVAMVYPEKLPHLLVGCVTIASNWQMMYGTLIYALSFVFNRRHEGHNVISVAIFVIFSNIIWVIFPGLAIYAAVTMLKDGNMNVFNAS